MRPYRNIPILQWVMATALVAAAQFAIAPTQTEAACGDYVISGGQERDFRHAAIDRHRAPLSPDALRKHGPMSRAKREGLPLHRGGCSGPNCSNHDPRPLDAPTGPLAVEVRDWGLVAVQWLETTAAPRFARFADDDVDLRVATAPVYRPPR